jgi:hypothetical protein
MPSKLTPEDHALLRQAYDAGVLNLVEPDGRADGAPDRARRLEEAGLLRSVAGVSVGDERHRYYTLSGAGLSKLGPF